MTLTGSLKSLARRPKDTEGPPAVAYSASLVVFCGAMLTAASGIFQTNLRNTIFAVAAIAIIVSWLLALAAMKSVPKARFAVILQTPFLLASLLDLANWSRA